MTYFKLISIILSVCFISGCAITDWLASPSRIKLNGPIPKNIKTLNEGIDEFTKLCSKKLKSNCSGELEVIGHQAGSYRRFPMNKNKDGDMRGNHTGFFAQNTAKALNVSVLMDQAFKSDKINSIEIDVQAPPACNDHKPCSFAMHDNPANKKNGGWIKFLKNKDHQAYEYAKNNTTVNILKHFIERGYHKDGKHIYVELKATKDCMTPESNSKKCNQPVELVAEEIKPLLKSNQLKGKRNWVSIISFSANALAIANEKLDDLADYALIAGYDDPGFLWYRKWAGQLKGPVPEFTTGDNSFESFVLKNKWLNRVWYSPRGITDPEKTFGKIVKRENISFSTSVYDVSHDALEKSLSWGDLKDPFIKSMMIDIDDAQ